MKIEEAIFQKQFSHEFEKLVVNLTYTEKFFERHISDLLKPYGLTRQQYNVLRILRGQHPEAASINLVVERMIERSSNVSRLVDKLVDKELVTRKYCPEDRRRMDVKITSVGLNLLKGIDLDLTELYSRMKGLSTKEAQFLNTLLDKFRVLT